MKRWVIICALYLGYVLAGCGHRSSTHQESDSKADFPRHPLARPPSTHDEQRQETAVTGAEKMQGAFCDDEQSTVYIRVEDSDNKRGDEAAAEMMKKKERWQKRFPNKRIVAMSVVTGYSELYGHSNATGLLIHYETRE